MKTRSQLSAREVDALHEMLLHRLGDTSVPTLPVVAMRILELIADKTAGIKEFARVIETDQALSGRLLRMANSSFFGQRAHVTRVERAAILLGIDRLKALALGFHLTQAASSAEGAAARKRAWTRSLFAACLASRLTERFDPLVSGEAFVVALMSDAGVPLMPALIGDRYAQMIDESADPQSQFRAESATLAFTHVDVAAAMCQLWNLPEILRKPIANHHVRPLEVVKGDCAGLLHAVAYYAGGINVHPEVSAEAARESVELGLRLFGIEAEQMQAIVGDAAGDFESYKDFFRHILDGSMSIESIVAAVNEHLCSAVDELIAGSIEPAATPGVIRRFFTPNFVLEAARTPENTVRVYIDDPDGQRLITEEFAPSARSDQDLASMLMLEDLPAAEVNRVISTIRALAA